MTPHCAASLAACMTTDEFVWANEHATLVQTVLPEAIDLLAEVPAAP